MFQIVSFGFDAGNPACDEFSLVLLRLQMKDSTIELKHFGSIGRFQNVADVENVCTPEFFAAINFSDTIVKRGEILYVSTFNLFLSLPTCSQNLSNAYRFH